jgi:hypothetical protein
MHVGYKCDLYLVSPYFGTGIKIAAEKNIKMLHSKTNME